MNIGFSHLTNVQLRNLWDNLFDMITENRVDELDAILPDWAELSMSTDELRNEILDEMEWRHMELPD